MLRTNTLLSALVLLTFSFNASADWSLVNDASSLHFISTKKSSVAEVHHFRSLSGSVLDSGKVEINIDLTSVDTAVEIRDQRVRDLLFETSRFATATITADVDTCELKNATPGSVWEHKVKAELSLHGQTKPLDMELELVKLSEGNFLAFSKHPLIINAADFDLVKGVEALREIVKLPSISTAVPVTFSLVFEAQDN